MKTQNTLLRLSICLAIGGLVTIVVICFLIGFGFHSVVGKYALYTALFLQLLSLVVNYLADARYSREIHSYTPSKKMTRFRRIVTAFWVTGALLLLCSLVLILLGMSTTDLWVRILCVPGLFLCPIGWVGILLASNRRRSAIDDIIKKRNPKQGEA